MSLSQTWPRVSSRTDWSGLLAQVRQHRLQPEDRFEVAAILESMGWNDVRVQRELGTETVFDVADELWVRMQGAVHEQVEYAGVREPLWSAALTVIRTFLRGIIFAFPMAISVVSMLTLRFSLWSYQNLPVTLGTVIAVGTILSFMTVGGFTQAIARRGFFYIFQGYYVLAEKVTFYFIGLGFLMALSLAVLVWFVNIAFNLFPPYPMTLMILYFVFLTAIWLAVTVMYILQKELLFTGLIILGIAVVFVLFRVARLNIIYAQLIALAGIAFSSALLVLYLFHQADKKHGSRTSGKLARKSYIIYAVMPYFVYGFAYFTFLYVDRIIAWSTNDMAFMPYPIWFRGNYELGLDFALLILLLPMGTAEVILFSLMQRLLETQKMYLGDHIPRMNGRYVRNYLRNLLLILCVTLFSVALVYFGARWAFLVKFPHSIGRELFLDPTAYFVFRWGLVAYSFVAISLMNAVTLFSLSQPSQILKAIWPALFVNIVAGFLLTRWFSYSDAVFGLLAGSVVFFVLSSGYVVRVLSRLDYYLYAAS